MPKQPLSVSSQSSCQGVSSTERQLLPPERVERRHALHDSEILGQQRATKRVDFVSQLPGEVVSSLILPATLTLPTPKAFSYLHVCKTWRQRVLQSVHLHYNSFGKLTQGDIQLMVTYAPYLHKIRMGSPTLFPVGFFASAQFTCLQSLSLDLSSENDIHTMYLLLDPIAPTLKEIELSLYCATGNMGISLKDILRHFPNIEAFECNNVNVTDLIAHPQHIYKVKKLVLRSITLPLRSPDIIALLKRFPSLEILVLTDCQDSRPLATMHQCCPALGSLTYIMTGQTRSLVSDAPAVNISGLHSLSIYAGDNFNIQHLIPLLKGHCDTLVNIHIQNKINQQSNVTHLLPEQGVVFIQLSHLSFYPREANDGSALVQWILKRVPNACDIGVTKCNIDDNDVYEAMKHAKNLKSLSFSLPSPSFIHLLEYHGTLGQQSRLHSVMIDVNLCREHCVHAFKAVAHLTNLRKLLLYLRGPALGEEFVAFIENMARGCPFLEELILESFTEFPSAIIHKFPLYLKLRQLTLDSPNVWDECLLQLLKCPSLEDLFIDRYNIQHHVVEKLAHLIGEHE